MIYKEIIGTLQEFIKIIDELKAQFSHSKMGMDFSYRGLCDSTYKLIPNIYRKTTNEFTNTTNRIFLTSENEILSHFIKEASCYISRIDKDNYLSWLEYAQHFGAPTRLLDFTSNPLVALYFCCKENQETDGVIWVLNEKNYQQFLNHKSEYLKAKKHYNKKQILEDIIQNLKTYDPCIEYPCSYIPYYIDQRMIAQGSRFLIWGSNSKPLESIVQPCNYMEINKNGMRIECSPDVRFLFKITILGNCKREIIKQLDTCGINEKNLFPGIDGVGRYITAYYKMSYDDIVDAFFYK